MSELRTRFERDGFVRLPSFLAGDELTAIQNEVRRFLAERVPALPPEHVYYEDKADPNSLKQVQQLWQHDPALHAQMTEGPFAELATVLLGEPARPVNMQYFNKSPGKNQPTPPHQDGYYFHLQPNHALTMWFALEDVAPEQGCVHYVRGSNRYGMRHHARSGVLGFSQGITDFGVPNDLEQTVPCPCRAGDLIVHHALTIHWATGNTTTDRTRQALGFIYYADAATENAAAKAEYQRRLDEQLASAGKI